MPQLPAAVRHGDRSRPWHAVSSPLASTHPAGRQQHHAHHDFAFRHRDASVLIAPWLIKLSMGCGSLRKPARPHEQSKAAATQGCRHQHHAPDQNEKFPPRHGVLHSGPAPTWGFPQIRHRCGRPPRRSSVDPRHRRENPDHDDGEQCGKCEVDVH